MQDEYKIIVAIQNQQAIDQLNEKIVLQKKYIGDLAEALKRQPQFEQQYRQQMEMTAKSLLDNQAKVEGLTRGIQRLGVSMQGLGRGGGGGGAMGLMMLAQGVEDLQYGFSAIVNNIPGIAMGMGMGAGVAGALSMAAVAANQLSKNWDTLSEKMSNTAMFQAINGSLILMDDGVKKTSGTWRKFFDQIDAFMEKYKVNPIGANVSKMIREFFVPDPNAAAAKMAARNERADKMVAGLQGDIGGDQKKRAEAFKRAMDSYGGGKKLLDDVFNEQAKAMKIVDPRARENLQRGIALEIEKGLKGEEAGKNFGDRFKNLFNFEKVRPQQEALAKAAEEEMEQQQKKAKEGEARKELLNREGKQADRRMQQEIEFNAAAEDKEKIRAIQRKMEAIHDQQFDRSLMRGSVFGGARQYLASAQTNALNGVEREQLVALRAMQKDLEKIRIKADNRRDEMQRNIILGE